MHQTTPSPLPGSAPDSLREAVLDLVLGSTCTGCGRPGRLLCRRCWTLLPSAGFPAWPTPCPPGLVLPMAGGEYAGLLKALVNAHKERAQFALARPLGTVLASVVHDLVAERAHGGRWLLVPVPSRPGVVRRRGHDPMLRVSRYAAVLLRRRGIDVRMARLLVVGGRPADQAGLSAAGRAANLHGAMRCRPGPAGRVRDGRVAIVVDDVLTTGSTAREAQRALERGGVEVRGVATVAATRKQTAFRGTEAPGEERGDSGGSLPISG